MQLSFSMAAIIEPAIVLDYGYDPTFCTIRLDVLVVILTVWEHYRQIKSISAPCKFLVPDYAPVLSKFELPD